MLRLLLLSEWETDREMDKRKKNSSKFQMSWKEAFMPLFGELKRREGHAFHIFCPVDFYVDHRGRANVSNHWEAAKPQASCWQRFSEGKFE